VGNVRDDAQLVHPCHQVTTQIGEPGWLGIQRTTREGIRVVMGQLEYAEAQLVTEVESPQVPLEGLGSLKLQEHSGSPPVECLADLCASRGEKRPGDLSVQQAPTMGYEGLHARVEGSVVADGAVFGFDRGDGGSVENERREPGAADIR
jgi:hypothetical protein